MHGKKTNNNNKKKDAMNAGQSVKNDPEEVLSESLRFIWSNALISNDSVVPRTGQDSSHYLDIARNALFNGLLDFNINDDDISLAFSPLYPLSSANGHQQTVLRMVFSQLVWLQEQIGWDALLAVRSRCFVMMTDEASVEGKRTYSVSFKNTITIANNDSSSTVALSNVSGNGMVNDGQSQLNGYANNGYSNNGYSNNGYSNNGYAHSHYSAMQTSTVESPSASNTAKTKQSSMKKGVQIVTQSTLNASSHLFASPNALANTQTTISSNTPSKQTSASKGILGHSKQTVNSTTNGISNSSYAKKTICEQWLDGLFGLLYQHLHAHAIWRAEMLKHREQRLDYVRTAADWLALAVMAANLGHHQEAQSTLLRCIAQQPNIRATDKTVQSFQMRDSSGTVALALLCRYCFYELDQLIQQQDVRTTAEQKMMPLNSKISKTTSLITLGSDKRKGRKQENQSISIIKQAIKASCLLFKAQHSTASQLISQGGQMVSQSVRQMNAFKCLMDRIVMALSNLSIKEQVTEGKEANCEDAKEMVIRMARGDAELSNGLYQWNSQWQQLYEQAIMSK